jgi:ribosomal protein S18 acetylase RimI-like enzyme
MSATHRGTEALGIEIRDAQPADAAGLAPLLEALGYPAEPSTIAQRVEALPADDPTSRVLVAVAGGAIAGFATLHVTPVLHRPTAVGRITGIAVLPSLKGSGVGRALVRAAEAHFERLGLARLEVTSGPAHVAAYDFYRRLGYDDQGVRFAKALKAD